MLLLVCHAGGVEIDESASAFQYVRLVRLVRFVLVVRQVSRWRSAGSRLPSRGAGGPWCPCRCSLLVSAQILPEMAMCRTRTKAMHTLPTSPVQLFVLTVGSGAGSLVPGLRVPPRLSHALNVAYSSLVLLHSLACLW